MRQDAGAQFPSRRAIRPAGKVRRFIAGDEDAFRVIAERYQKRVLRYLSRYFKLEDDAADLTQETLLALLRQIERNPHICQEDATLGPFILTIAARAAIDELRRISMRRRKEGVVALFPVAQLSGAQATAAAMEIEHDVHQALAKLPPTLRRVALLYFLAGFSSVDVAEETGSTLAAVKSQIRRSRDLLAVYLNSYSKGANHDIRPLAAGRAGEPAAGRASGLHR